MMPSNWHNTSNHPCKVYPKLTSGDDPHLAAWGVRLESIFVFLDTVVPSL